MLKELKGTILDGRWEIDHKEKDTYVFVNIYNGNKITLSLRQVKKILNGEESISHIQCRRMGKNRRGNSPNWWGNGVVRGFARQRQIHKLNK